MLRTETGPVKTVPDARDHFTTFSRVLECTLPVKVLLLILFNFYFVIFICNFRSFISKNIFF